MHDHACSHHPAPVAYGRLFALSIGLNLVFVAVEWGYGVRAGSLALVADAGHNLGDVLGLVLAWIAYALGKRRPTGRFSYGFGRTSILAALFNALLLVAAVGGIAWEAIHRLLRPTPVAAGIMMAVAAVGIVLNTATALLFLRGRREDLNLRGAFLHMALDALVSLGVVVTGLVVLRTGWRWMDPLVSLVISAVILAGTWGLLKEALQLILDAVPAGVDLAQVRALMCQDARVQDVHDLHVWAMSTTEKALSAHVVMVPGTPPDPLLAHLAESLEATFHIHHSTIQLEGGDSSHPCEVRC